MKRTLKDKLEFASNKSHKWMSLAMDKIPNFWISSFSKGHEKLASPLSEIVESPDTASKWLSEVVTHCSLKTKDTKNPKNYRHITCLTTTYKLLTTSVLTESKYGSNRK